jgi:hypothetical protein
MTRIGTLLAIGIAVAGPLAAPACRRSSSRSDAATQQQPGPAELARRERNAELEATQVEQQPQGTTRVHEVSGKLVRADADDVVLRRDDDPKAPELRLRIAPGATVTIDGQHARPTDIAKGTEVRASYEGETGATAPPTALRVEAVTRGGEARAVPPGR